MDILRQSDGIRGVGVEGSRCAEEDTMLCSSVFFHCFVCDCNSSPIKSEEVVGIGQ